MSDTVTWTRPEGVVWHDDLVIDDRPYPTRHPAPAGAVYSGEYLGDLTYGQRDHLRAVHEAAHAVAILAAGGCVHEVWTSLTEDLRGQDPSDSGVIGGRTDGCGLPDALAFVVFQGAGERAEDRWLRERALWTPSRAVGVELGAYGDRQGLLHHNPHIGFGTGTDDYLVVHHLADEFLAQHWHAVLAVAEPLAARLRLTGAETADLAGMPNGPHSPTCTH